MNRVKDYSIRQTTPHFNSRKGDKFSIFLDPIGWIL